MTAEETGGSPTDGNAQAKAIVMLAIDRGFNGGDLDVADEVFSDDYNVHAPGLNELPKGPAAFKQAIGIWRTAFPDIHMEVQELVCEGDIVANRFLTQGTNDGPLFGMPPTNKRIRVNGMEMHRVVDGRVVESWICDDIPSILMQLGIATWPGAEK